MSSTKREDAWNGVKSSSLTLCQFVCLPCLFASMSTKLASVSRRGSFSFQCPVFMWAELADTSRFSSLNSLFFNLFFHSLYPTFSSSLPVWKTVSIEVQASFFCECWKALMLRYCHSQNFFKEFGSKTTTPSRSVNIVLYLGLGRLIVFLQTGATSGPGWGMLNGSLTRVCNRDDETDGGRQGFVHPPFPTLLFTFCCEERPGLSDMTNRSACLTESTATGK